MQELSVHCIFDKNIVIRFEPHNIIGQKPLLMEGGQTGVLGALVNHIVEGIKTEPVTPLLLFLMEMTVLCHRMEMLWIGYVMGVTAVLVKK